MTAQKLITEKYEHAAVSIGNISFETTGYCGGDSGHGGRLTIRIEDEANLIFDAKVLKHRHSPHTKSVEISFYGDAEMEAAYAFFKFLANRLAPVLEKN
jgi:hypothetical protein